jgi:hypothetical protein
MAILRSVYARSNDHVQSTYELHELQSGQIRAGYPTIGSWITYGLGSETSGLPAYVVIRDPRGGPIGGVSGWSAGFMPAAFQGTAFRSSGGDSIMDLKPPAGLTSEQQRARLDVLAKLNERDLQKYPGDSELAARVSSYELAFRMQACAPQAVDLSNESQITRKL